MYDHYAILLYKFYLPEKLIAVNSLNGRKHQLHNEINIYINEIILVDYYLEIELN